MALFDILDDIFGFDNHNARARSATRGTNRPLQRNTLASNGNGQVVAQETQQSGFLRHVLGELGVEGAETARVNRIITEFAADPETDLQADAVTATRGDGNTQRPRSQEVSDPSRQAADAARTEQQLLDTSLSTSRTDANAPADTITSDAARLESILARLDRILP